LQRYSPTNLCDSAQMAICWRFLGPAFSSVSTGQSYNGPLLHTAAIISINTGSDSVVLNIISASQHYLGAARCYRRSSEVCLSVCLPASRWTDHDSVSDVDSGERKEPRWRIRYLTGRGTFAECLADWKKLKSIGFWELYKRWNCEKKRLDRS